MSPDHSQNSREQSRQRHKDWKAKREQRRSQRQTEQEQRIADRPVSHDSGFPQVSSRRMGIPQGVGSQHAKAEQEYHQQKQQPTLNPTAGRRPTVSETMGRVVRPPLDDDREHKHGHSL